MNNYMPCGFVVPGSLKDLGHYKKCEDQACKAKAMSWDAHKAEAREAMLKYMKPKQV